MPVASATTGTHRDYPVLASVAQWPEIQPLMSRGQIVSADIWTPMHGHTTIINIMIIYSVIH